MLLTHWFKPVDSTEVAAAASVAAVDRENIDLQNVDGNESLTSGTILTKQRKLRLESLLPFKETRAQLTLSLSA